MKIQNKKYLKMVTFDLLLLLDLSTKNLITNFQKTYHTYITKSKNFGKLSSFV